jgi:hypothetical protein
MQPAKSDRGGTRLAAWSSRERSLRKAAGDGVVEFHYRSRVIVLQKAPPAGTLSGAAVNVRFGSAVREGLESLLGDECNHREGDGKYWRGLSNHERITLIVGGGFDDHYVRTR